MSATPAASVLLSRGAGSRELYAVRRGAHLKFFGGFWAFPGGRLDPADLELAGGDEAHALRIAGCRELFEETGVLLARPPHGRFVPWTDELYRIRRELLLGRMTFAHFLAVGKFTIRAEDFTHVGRLTTPPFSAQRYATTFFTARMPAEQRADVWRGELDEGRWVEPAALLAEWTRGECLVTPPSVTILEALSGIPIEEGARRLEAAFARQGEGLIPPIFFAPRVQVIPLRTAALPPATHTNALLVGAGPRYLIDPGPDDPAEQQRLFDRIDGPIDAVVLTHHHPDHVGAAAACARRYGVPVWAHALTAQRLGIAADRTLEGGDRLDLGPCPADGGAWFLEALHTPGHAAGHLAFFEPRYGLLLAGDLVSTITPIVIAPPEGDLAVYLASLRRVRELPARLLVPSHGNASARPRATIDEALEHRAKREAQLVEALADGPDDVAGLVPRLYRGLPDELLRFARAQTLAGLYKLEREGRARPAGAGRWELINGG